MELFLKTYRLIYQSIYLSRIPVIRIKYQSWEIILNIMPTFKFGLNILCSCNLYVSRSRVTLHSRHDSLLVCFVSYNHGMQFLASFTWDRCTFDQKALPSEVLRTFPSACCSLTPCLMAFSPLPSRSLLRGLSNDCGCFVCLFWFVFVIEASSALPPGKHLGLWNGSTIKTQLDTQAPNRYGREESLAKGLPLTEAKVMDWQGPVAPHAFLRSSTVGTCLPPMLLHAPQLWLAEAPPRFVSWHHASMLLSEALSLFYHLEQDAGVEERWLGQDASEKTLEWRLLALPPTSFWPKVKKEEKTLIDNDCRDFIPTLYINLQVFRIK